MRYKGHIFPNDKIHGINLMKTWRGLDDMSGGRDGVWGGGWVVYHELKEKLTSTILGDCRGIGRKQFNSNSFVSFHRPPYRNKCGEDNTEDEEKY